MKQDVTATERERVLVLAPTPADTALTRTILSEANLACHICADLRELLPELERGAGAILLTEEALAARAAQGLTEALRSQPPWSDFPILLLAGDGADSSIATWAMEWLGNVTVLEQPVRVTTLVSALRTAIRSRRRQYELRDLIAALSHSEERFKLVAQSVHDSIWDLDLATARIWSSESMRSQSGFEPRDFDLDAWTRRRHPEDREHVAASFRHALESGASFWTHEYRYRLLDGSYVDVLDRGHILRDPRGRPVRAVGAMLDISDRKRAEEARALNAAIVESSDDAIVSKTVDGTILSWNAGAERLFGYSADEVIGQSITLIIPPGQRDEESAILEQIRKGQRIDHFETVRLTKQGRAIDVSLTVSPVRGDRGQIIGASKVARDISARKNAEEKLRRQGERLRMLWEAASVLLAADDPDVMLRALFGRIAPHLHLDAYFNYMLNETGEGLRLQSYVGIPEEEASKIAELDFDQDLCGSVAMGREPLVATHIQESGDPRVQLVKGYGFRVYACTPLVVDGRLLGTLSFASRLRDAFDAEELEFLRTIYHYVTVAYERARLVDELRNTDRRKDEFLATLAHELRNPLAPIRNALQIIRLAGSDGAAVEQARTMMERQLGQMVRLIDDLLDVSRITRGKLELRKEWVELAAVLKQALETARPLIEASGHELRTSLPPRPVYLDADPVRLAQVFSNLLNNAAKYMDRGGRIWLSAAQRGSEVDVTVRDTGMGIPAAALPDIFEMFTQVERSLERSQGGLGIGLTLARRLVELHGGSIEARSEGEGKGTEFVARLPIVAEPPAPTPSLGERRRATPMAYRILVADDNHDAAESMSMMLRLMGHEVRTVHDGQQAVDEADSFRPDVILLDIGMPRLNGYDAARRIREQRWGKALVLVALTGWGQEEDKRQASEAGFDRHFTKPVNPAHLEQLMAGLAADARLRDRS